MAGCVMKTDRENDMEKQSTLRKKIVVHRVENEETGIERKTILSG